MDTTLLDSIFVLAGHGDSITGNYSDPQSGGADDGGGIGTAPIVAVVLLAMATVGVLVWLNRQERQSGSERPARTLNLRSAAPLGLISAVIATPLILWTASSGGDEESLKVERWTNDTTNSPELLVSLLEKDLNTLGTTNGKKTVRLECSGRQGQSVLVAKPKWPFIEEPGYDYPHIHQATTREQLQRADRCRLVGTNVSLEADVKGALTG